MHWRALAPLLVALPLAACLETNLTLKPDGTIAGTISWTAADKVPEPAVRALLVAEGVTIKRVDLVDVPADKDGRPPARPQRITAEVDAKDVTALAAVPLFSAFGVSAQLGEPEASKRKLTVRAAKREGGKPIPDTDNVVRLHLPGAIVETSATASGHDLTWTIPASHFKTRKHVELSVIYAAGPSAAPQAQGSGTNEPEAKK